MDSARAAFKSLVEAGLAHMVLGPPDLLQPNATDTLRLRFPVIGSPPHPVHLWFCWFANYRRHPQIFLMRTEPPNRAADELVLDHVRDVCPELILWKEDRLRYARVALQSHFQPELFAAPLPPAQNPECPKCHELSESIFSHCYHCNTPLHASTAKCSLCESPPAPQPPQGWPSSVFLSSV